MVGCTRRRPGGQGSLRGTLDRTKCSRFRPVCLGARAEKPRPDVATLPSRRMWAPLRTWRALGGAGELCAHGEASECGALGARDELNAPAWPRASQFEELAPRARRHTHRCRKHLANTRSISYRPPIPHGQCWREIRLVLPRCDLLRRANFEYRGEGVFVNCFRVPSHVPTPAIICERTARFCRQGFGRNHRSG